jgi:hypothetical protein
MNQRELCHRLFYSALIELRAEAHEIKNSKVFHIADLFHNIPLQLEKAAKGELQYEEILAWLENRAIQNGCQEWLYNLIKNEKTEDNEGT